jgi:hypothetical protein
VKRQRCEPTRGQDQHSIIPWSMNSSRTAVRMVKAHPALLLKVQFNEQPGCGAHVFRLHRIV